MLRREQTHPRQAEGLRARLANWLLFFGGVAFLAFALVMAGGPAAKEIGLVEGEPNWRAAWMSLFFVLCASECFTTNITKWAGDVLRGIAGKIGGNSRGSS